MANENQARLPFRAVNHVATYMDKDFTKQELEMYSSNIYNLWVPAQNDQNLKFAAGKVI